MSLIRLSLLSISLLFFLGCAASVPPGHSAVKGFGILGGPSIKVSREGEAPSSSIAVLPKEQRLRVEYRSEYFVPDDYPNEQCYVCYYLSEHAVSFTTKLNAEYRLKAEASGGDGEFSIFAVEIPEGEYPNGHRIPTESEQLSSRRKCGFSYGDTACEYS